MIFYENDEKEHQNIINAMENLGPSSQDYKDGEESRFELAKMDGSYPWEVRWKQFKIST